MYNRFFNKFVVKGIYYFLVMKIIMRRYFSDILARYLFVCKHITRIILARGFTEIATTPSRFASSRKNIYMVVSGKPANDLQTNMCNSTALTPGPVAGTVSAFQTCSQTQRNYPITFTLCSRDCSQDFQTLLNTTARQSLYRSDFKASHYMHLTSFVKFHL